MSFLIGIIGMWKAFEIDFTPFALIPAQTQYITVHIFAVRPRLWSYSQYLQNHS